MRTVEVFKTDVEEEEEARKLSLLLALHFPEADIHFDLEDCDHILRVEGIKVQPDQVMVHMQQWGYECRVLN